MELYRGPGQAMTALAGSPHPGVIMTLGPMYLLEFDKVNPGSGHVYLYYRNTLLPFQLILDLRFLRLDKFYLP